MAGRDLSNIIGNLYLLIVYISAFTCLMRTDYNFAFALFFYLIWTIRKDVEIMTILIYGNLGLVIMDIVWFVTVAPAWTEVSEESSLWNELRSSHILVIFLSFFNLLIKLISTGLLFASKRNPDESQQSMIRPTY